MSEPEVIDVLGKKEESSVLNPIESIIEEQKKEAETLSKEKEEPIIIEEPVEEVDSANSVGIEEPEGRFITLQLGDVILIRDPANEILDNNVFLIDYIDNSKIKLISETDLQQVQLRISPDGVIGDGTISQIELLSRNDNLGYARQDLASQMRGYDLAETQGLSSYQQNLADIESNKARQIASDAQALLSLR